MMDTTLKSTKTVKKRSAPLSGESWKPHAYQKRAIKWLLERTSAALWLDPGLGKTSVTLAAVSMLKKMGKKPRVLIVAPLRVCYSVWPAEAARWAEFNHLKVAVLHGPDREKALSEDADIYVINPEGLDWLLDVTKKRSEKTGKVTVTANVKKFRSYKFDTLVLDEISKFKHTNTNRFKSLRQVLVYFQRRWGLTGSPASNGLLDLFGQCYCLDMGKALGEYITHYKSHYFLPVGAFGWRLKEGAEELIYDRVRDLALRMEAEDYIELPQKLDNIISLELPADARKIYGEMEDEMFTMIDENAMTAINAATVSGKCRQIASGALYKEAVDPLTGIPLKGKREYVNIHDVKLQALTDLIEEMQGQPLLIAYEYGHDLDRLLKHLGKDTPYIGGGVSPKKATELERAWNANELPVLLAHPASMGHGLNLQYGQARNIAWYTLTWDYELYDQFNRRIRRQGNTNQHVTVHHFIVRNTVETAVMNALRVKRRTQNHLLDAVKDYRAMRKDAAAAGRGGAAKGRKVAKPSKA